MRQNFGIRWNYFEPLHTIWSWESYKKFVKPQFHPWNEDCNGNSFQDTMKRYLCSIWQTEFQYNFQLNLCSAYKAPHTKHITSFILITPPSGMYHCHPHFTEKETEAQRSRKTWPRSPYEQGSQDLAQDYLLTCLIIGGSFKWMQPWDDNHFTISHHTFLHP